MAKQIFQDIVPPEKRSIKKIPVPSRNRRSVSPAKPAPAPAQTMQQPVQPKPSRAKRVAVDYSNDEPLQYSPETEAEMASESMLKTIPARQPIDTTIDSMQAQRPPVVSAPPVSPSLPPRRIPFYQEYEAPKSRIPWKALIILIVAIAIVAGTYIVLSHYAKATVTVTPKTATISLNNNFIADMVSTTTAPVLPGQIQYEVITAVKDGASQVPSTGVKTIQTKATGSIIIYNNYSTSAQKLVATTRFETASGLIYRIISPVTVPGKHGSTPGNVTATVTADQAGSQYDIDLSDFTIPGFSGSPMYTGFYARSKTPMTGGYSGAMPTIDPSVLETTQATIDAEVESSLLEQLKENTPVDYTVLPNAWIIDDVHQPSTIASSTDSTGEAVVHEEGTIQAFAFKTATLANQIALTATSSAATPDITWQLLDPSGINFSLATASTSAALWTAPSVSFTLQGTTTVTALIDNASIKNNLAGKAKSSFDQILQAFPAVGSAQMSIQPFWQIYFPTNPANINIVTNATTPPAGY